MAEVDYDLLYEQLNSLMCEAPCRGKGITGDCVGDMGCEYGINALYGCKCAIESVIEGTIYKQIKE